jgi:pimeloyl-ACP methyl ester carboxylesterase
MMNTFRSVDGTTIAFNDEGIGPAVVLLHGYGLDGLGNFGHFDRSRSQFERTLELWRAELGPAPPMPDPPREGQPGLIPRLLAAGARAITVDLRGFGASDKPRDPAAYANSAMARDVDALITHLDLDSVDVLGYSMGAGVALRLLALGVPHVKSAILVGIGQYALKDEILEFPENFPVPDYLPKPLTSQAWAEHGAATLERGKIDPANLASAHIIMAKAIGADPVVLAAVIRGAIAEGVSAETLERVEVPVLVLNGRADVANQKVERLLAAIPNSRSASCEGDHYSTPFQPTFHQAVVGFLEEQWRAHRASVKSQYPGQGF